MSIAMVRLLGLTALAGLIVLCVFTHAAKIQQALADSARQVAGAEGAGDAVIWADGRDIVVEGLVPDSALTQRVTRAIAAIPGIRTVTVDAGRQQENSDASGTELPEASFVVRKASPDAPLELSGVVPTTLPDGLLPATAESIDDSGLQVDDVRLKGSPEVLAAVVQVAQQQLQAGQVEIHGDEIKVSGRLADTVSLSAIEEKLSPFTALGYRVDAMAVQGTVEPETGGDEADETLPGTLPPAGEEPATISALTPTASSDPGTDAALAHCRSEVETLLSQGSIRFRNGSAALHRASKALLDQLAEALRQCPATAITITGHTDSRGDEQANQRLSEVRAMAVGDYLVSKGIEPGRIKTVGRGESEPIADNDTAAGRAQNRRIEITLEEGVER